MKKVGAVKDLYRIFGAILRADMKSFHPARRMNKETGKLIWEVGAIQYFLLLRQRNYPVKAILIYIIIIILNITIFKVHT